MPAWGGRIPSYQIWQITAYVRSLSGLTPSIAMSSRPDHMMYTPGSTALPTPVPTQPKQSFTPPASEMP
jgi:cytochrome c oxidase cbb3-type subunit 3